MCEVGVMMYPVARNARDPRTTSEQIMNGLNKVWLLLVAAITTGLNVAEAQGHTDAASKKRATCVACHGADGNSTVPEVPKLAGEHPKYLIKQLTDFKSGARKNEIMGPMAAALTEEGDLADVSVFYARQVRQAGAADSMLIKAGERLFRGGNPQSGLPACMACHGPSGAGNPAAGFPAVGGQHGAYTAVQLKAYRSGERNNDPAGIMRTIAAKMTDAEIEAVASYAAGLH